MRKLFLLSAIMMILLSCGKEKTFCYECKIETWHWVPESEGICAGGCWFSHSTETDTYCDLTEEEARLVEEDGTVTVPTVVKSRVTCNKK